MTRAGIPREGENGARRTFHSFRHSYAKFALEQELPLFWLSRQLGHSSTRVTEMVYGRWEKKARQEAAQKLEGVFGV
jgi:integrase